ncbi:uncharacterized protein LY89DRAFT_684000 [Mollisia scopiformis]|uniref:Uncharacterized protein n=1 Tax=Mollisia scopiformis TaxID=149040 RepID=A0A194XD08_MOLSC|nr:uncharacterized protein LY89DRAFT_684000 [Mollisia scopiformis]KUJ18060.1 hypothetical protein LY89DRAFT_684000 [Mollisia scopiformis]
MTSSSFIDGRHQLDRFCRQYLQVLQDLEYPSGENLRNYEFQQDIYNRLFADDAAKHPSPARYRVRVLKELVQRIEASIQDWDNEAVSDDIMSCLSSLIASGAPSEAVSAQQKAYVTCSLAFLSSSSDFVPTITLLEARNLIAAAGTTGLRTWEAALHLGNYLAQKPNLVQGKSVLELGAGTGYISILCARYLGASHIVSTDGSDDVLADLPTNFYLNGLQESSIIEAKELRWGHILIGGEQPEWNGGRKIDLVLGADLTYDTTAVRALVATFGDLFELFPEIHIIIASPIRNEKTFQTFLETCRRNKYGVEEIEYEIPKPELQEGPFYSDAVPIHISRITKS